MLLFITWYVNSSSKLINWSWKRQHPISVTHRQWNYMDHVVLCKSGVKQGQITARTRLCCMVALPGLRRSLMYGTFPCDKYISLLESRSHLTYSSLTLKSSFWCRLIDTYACDAGKFCINATIKSRRVDVSQIERNVAVALIQSPEGLELILTSWTKN